MRLTVRQAYGRNRTSAKAIKADFEANLDFIICDLFSGQDGRYVNAEHLAVGDTLNVRYKNDREVAVLTKKAPKTLKTVIVERSGIPAANIIVAHVGNDSPKIDEFGATAQDRRDLAKHGIAWGD